MRALYLTAAGLFGVLLAVPAPAEAGPCGYAPTYYQPTYVAPSVTTYTPTTQYVPVETFYSVGQATLNARLVQEAAEASVAKFKAELAAQAQAQAAAARDEQDRAFKAQVLQLLSQREAPGGPDPEKEQLKADNAQMRAALRQIVDAQKAKPPAAPPPAAPPASAPGAPKVEGPAPAPPSGGSLAASARATLTACFKSRCASCHDGKDQKTLGDPDAMPTERLADCVARMRSPDPKRRMPKTGDAVTPEQYFAAEDLLLARVTAKSTGAAAGN